MHIRYSTSKVTILFAIASVLVTTWTLWPVSVATAAIYQVNYTGLGDSIAFGLYAFPGQGYVPLYAKGLHNFTNLNVNLYPLGVPGWTSSDLANALKSNILFQLFVANSDAITWDIGGNDLNQARSSYKAGTCGGEQCLKDAVTTFQSNWCVIVNKIGQLRHGHATILRTMDIYNPYVDEDTAAGDFNVLNGYLMQVNDVIHSTEPAGILYARVYDAFNKLNGMPNDPVVDPASKGLLAFDGFHPNAAGHALIAAKLNQQLYGVTIPTVPFCQ